MRIHLIVPISPYTGYGSDGIGMSQALIRAGHDVTISPDGVDTPLPSDVADLLKKPINGHYDLVISHVNPMLLKSDRGLKYNVDRHVGWSMWEWSNFRNMKGRSKLRKELRNFDVLVGYDDNTVNGFSEYFSGPILKQQGGFEPDPWQPLQRDWDQDEFYFSQIGVLSPRKNPFANVAAFGALKEKDVEFNKNARLMLKTTTPGLHSKMEDVYPGLRVFYDVWPRELVQKYYQSTHVLLAPSRGEGKNLPALEFQATGGTVIATNWGGHTEWLDPEINYAVDYSLSISDPKYPTTYDAEISGEDLQEKMLHVFRNRDEAKAKGELAAQRIRERHSWDAIMPQFIEKVTSV